MGAFRLICGFHAINLRLEKDPKAFFEIILKDNYHNKRTQQLTDKAKQHGILMHLATKHQLDEMTQGAHHQGVVAKIKVGEMPLTIDEVLNPLKTPALLMVLDGVTDPHNLGACLRVADAMGAHAIIAAKDHCVPLTPTVSKIASGAAESVPYILVTNLVATLEALKKRGVKITGLVLEESKHLFECSATEPIAWVLGSEGKGMRRLTKEHCDETVNLPMQGTVESLNVSVCAGIILAETYRQRLIKQLR